MGRNLREVTCEMFNDTENDYGCRFYFEVSQNFNSILREDFGWKFQVFWDSQILPYAARNYTNFLFDMFTI